MNEPAPSKPVTALWRWLGGFRRVTTSGRYIPEIDGLRFIAIAGVFLHHVALELFQRLPRSGGEGWFNLGQSGVQLFFAISGFILAVPFADHFIHRAPRVKLSAYFLRRLTRLEPPYLISLLVLFYLKPGVRGWDPAIVVPSLFASIAYVHNIVFGIASHVNGVAWSLEIEVQFYILMPLLGFIFAIGSRLVRRLILLVCMIGIILLQPIRFPAVYGPLLVERHLGNYIQFFLAGLLVADIYVADWRDRPLQRRWGDFVWLVLPASFLALWWHGGLIAQIAFPLTLVALMLAVFRSYIVRRVMAWPPIAIVGGMCYSIYLLHNAVIVALGNMMSSIVSHVPETFRAPLASLLYILPVLIVSGIFFRIVEKPCMRRDWPKRLATASMSFIFKEEPTDAPSTDLKSGS